MAVILSATRSKKANDASLAVVPAAYTLPSGATVIASKPAEPSQTFCQTIVPKASNFTTNSPAPLAPKLVV